MLGRGPAPTPKACGPGASRAPSRPAHTHQAVVLRPRHRAQERSLARAEPRVGVSHRPRPQKGLS